jgi:glycosyltransferase involved in cell wall biosynthesis
MRFRFITSTPLNVIQGSGTFAGITTLAKFLRQSGHTVDMITPTLRFPVYTLQRVIFNESLRFRRTDPNEVTVGFDMDGYTLAGPSAPGLHIASIKGVIADEMRFERGITRVTMKLQARCEKKHIQRANLVLAPSYYSARQIQTLYGVEREPCVIPEPIDLAEWRRLLDLNPAQPGENKFVVLCVCRFYPRKRLHILLAAADRLRSTIPQLEVRIVGDGPEASQLKAIYRNKHLQGIVTWLGNISQSELAAEYNRCHVFCLPSVQESFGVVFLEAMASGKPIIAARAGSAPEVVKHGILAEPDDAQSLAAAIERLYRDPALRTVLAADASQWLNQFDGPEIASAFVREVESHSARRA